MQSTICFDFGNTLKKYALFQEGKMIEHGILAEDSLASMESLLAQFNPSHSILSSVINHDVAFETLLASKTQFHKLSHKSILPITTPVGKPETIGADRLALCSAATFLYPNQHILVVALGSCITFNFVNAQHQFLGGSISPGLNMRFKAMHEHTALLPLVKPTHYFPLVGYDTKTNLLCGVILGMAKEIDGIVEMYNERYANLKVLLTGGNMGFFIPHLRQQITPDSELLFKGLYAISQTNSLLL